MIESLWNRSNRVTIIARKNRLCFKHVSVCLFFMLFQTCFKTSCIKISEKFQTCYTFALMCWAISTKCVNFRFPRLSQTCLKVIQNFQTWLKHDWKWLKHDWNMMMVIEAACLKHAWLCQFPISQTFSNNMFESDSKFSNMFETCMWNMFETCFETS